MKSENNYCKRRYVRMCKFCVFTKMGKFAWIEICVLRMIVSLCFYYSNFHDVHIFADIQETPITRKYVQRENFCIHSIYFS